MYVSPNDFEWPHLHIHINKLQLMATFTHTDYIESFFMDTFTHIDIKAGFWRNSKNLTFQSKHKQMCFVCACAASTLSVTITPLTLTRTDLPNDNTPFIKQSISFNAEMYTYSSLTSSDGPIYTYISLKYI